MGIALMAAVMSMAVAVLPDSSGAAVGRVGGAPPLRLAAGSSGLSAGDACPASTGRIPLSGGVHILVHDGVRRSYRLAMPVDYDGRLSRPVVFDFHGFRADAALEEQRSRLGVVGAGRGFVVVTPDALGTPRRWNTMSDPGKADDIGFVGALLTDLASRFCLDGRRVYATGHSNGAEFAAALVCRSARFAAVAMVSSTFEARCPAGRAPATMAVHGTADPSVPYGGGVVAGSSTRVPAAPAVVRAYADRYGCNPIPRTAQPAPGIVARRYVGCAGGGEVLFDTVVGGTHLWPASPEARRDPRDSAAGRAFDATGAILDFFTAHEGAGVGAGAPQGHSRISSSRRPAT
ncbi:alpha/beta hydrolase family esterase [Frankia gtarii]|uniref:alpha/beta hydrolase family esterase n=2 Tax=Frankia gtarii TaxID=2950102 RepID=UPI0021C006A7|nr:PHB depolymerase family esterase [Frankia gtarii]